MSLNAYIGFDSRFPNAYRVACSTLRRQCGLELNITPLLLPDLQAKGLYKRPTIEKDGGLWDVISDAPMATEFSLSRFLIPYLNNYKGYSIFCDSDFLFRADVADLLTEINPHAPLACVHHDFNPTESIKMDGRIQTQYKRKNWSSFMVFNNAHPQNAKLTLDYFNTTTGRALHAFEWLVGYEITKLRPQWNYLVGHSQGYDGLAVHYTDGTPDLAKYADCEYAKEWHEALGAI